MEPPPAPGGDGTSDDSRLLTLSRVFKTTLLSAAYDVETLIVARTKDRWPAPRSLAQQVQHLARQLAELAPRRSHPQISDNMADSLNGHYRQSFMEEAVGMFQQCVINLGYDIHKLKVVDKEQAQAAIPAAASASAHGSLSSQITIYRAEQEVQSLADYDPDPRSRVVLPRMLPDEQQRTRPALQRPPQRSSSILPPMPASGAEHEQGLFLPQFLGSNFLPGSNPPWPDQRSTLSKDFVSPAGADHSSFHDNSFVGASASGGIPRPVMSRAWSSGAGDYAQPPGSFRQASGPLPSQQHLPSSAAMFRDGAPVLPATAEGGSSRHGAGPSRSVLPRYSFPTGSDDVGFDLGVGSSASLPQRMQQMPSHRLPQPPGVDVGPERYPRSIEQTGRMQQTRGSGQAHVPVKRGRRSQTAGRKCSNCSTADTRQWVRGENQQWLCHSCGQFWRKNGYARPRGLWNRPTFKRSSRRSFPGPRPLLSQSRAYLRREQGDMPYLPGAPYNAPRDNSSPAGHLAMMQPPAPIGFTDLGTASQAPLRHPALPTYPAGGFSARERQIIPLDDVRARQAVAAAVKLEGYDNRLSPSTPSLPPVSGAGSGSGSQQHAGPALSPVLAMPPGSSDRTAVAAAESAATSAARRETTLSWGSPSRPSGGE